MAQTEYQHISEWLNDQHDDVINYALARLYWFSSSGLKREQLERAQRAPGMISQGGLTRSRSRSARQRLLSAPQQRSQSGYDLQDLPQTKGRRVELRKAIALVDQMTFDELSSSLLNCFHREVQKRERKSKHSSDQVKFQDADIRLITKIITRGNGLEHCKWIVRQISENPENTKAYERLANRIDDVVYYAMLLRRPVKELIAYEEDYQVIDEYLAKESSSLQELSDLCQNRRNERAWYKLINYEISILIKSNKSANGGKELSEDTDDVDPQSVSPAHKAIGFDLYQRIFAQVIRALKKDQSLKADLFTTKHTQHEKNYGIWLDTLIDNIQEAMFSEGEQMTGIHERFDHVFYVDEKNQCGMSNLKKLIKSKPLSRFRDHVNQRLNVLMTQYLEELKRREESRPVYEAWVEWADLVERSSQHEKIFKEERLPDLTTNMMVSLLLASTLVHEELCSVQAHQNCSYTASLQVEGLDHDALKKLVYFGVASVLVNSVTRKRSGTDRRKAKEST